MKKKPPRRWMPHKDEILAVRWLRPVRRFLDHDHLWDLKRPNVARGVAVGLFAGVMLPVAQIFFAVVGAVAVRGHVPVSAACTFVTNPLTVPPLYWLAYQIGGFLLPDYPRALASLEEAGTWLARALDWAVSAGVPLLTGLLVLASASAVLGYVLVWLLWPAEPAGGTPPPPPG